MAHSHPAHQSLMVSPMLPGSFPHPALLATEDLTDSEPVALHTQLPITLWVVETSLQAQHSYQSLLRTGWSQTWVFWHIPPAGRGGFTCPQSLARCHAAGGGHPRPLGYLGRPLG